MGLDSEEDAIRVSREAVKIMSNATINLRKWNSNSRSVREAFGSGYAAVNQKVLGLNWFVLADEISVATNSMEESIRRGGASKGVVLSTIARVFDPLGMISQSCYCKGESTVSVHLEGKNLLGRAADWGSVS